MKKFFCTAITKSHLAFAKTLAEGLDRHNPGCELIVLLVDKVDGYFDPLKLPFRMIFLEDLKDDSNVRDMAFYYTPFEMCCAVRGLLHQWMADQGFESWIFLDSDIDVYGSFDIVWDLLNSSSIVVTPHLYRLDLEASDTSIQTIDKPISQYGIINGGFLGVANNNNSKTFISWFVKRLRKFCHSWGKEVGDFEFADQLWLEWLPFYYQDVVVLRCPGFNVAYWNLHEREMSSTKNNETMVEGEPLTFFHFSGLEIPWSGRVSRYSKVGAANKIMEHLTKGYIKRLLLNGFEKSRTWPYAYSYFDDGKEILQSMRQLFFSRIRRLDSGVQTNPFTKSSQFYKEERLLRVSQLFSKASAFFKRSAERH